MSREPPPPSDTAPGLDTQELEVARRQVEAAEAQARQDATQTQADPGTHPGPASALSNAILHGFPGYEVVRELSHGGQGVVYQAVQAATKRKVAIKVLLEGPYAYHAGSPLGSGDAPNPP